MTRVVRLLAGHWPLGPAITISFHGEESSLPHSGSIPPYTDKSQPGHCLRTEGAGGGGGCQTLADTPTQAHGERHIPPFWGAIHVA